jgi:hypothetical protein
MPTQIVFASMDPLVCPYLNLAVYVEMFGTRRLGRKIFDCKSTRGFTNYLEQLFLSPFFKVEREELVGSHSLRKGPSTYASRYVKGLDYPPWPLEGQQEAGQYIHRR